jgi:hypothetical protein
MEKKTYPPWLQSVMQGTLQQKLSKEQIESIQKLIKEKMPREVEAWVHQFALLYSLDQLKELKDKERKLYDVYKGNLLHSTQFPLDQFCKHSSVLGNFYNVPEIKHFLQQCHRTQTHCPFLLGWLLSKPKNYLYKLTQNVSAYDISAQHSISKTILQYLIAKYGKNNRMLYGGILEFSVPDFSVKERTQFEPYSKFVHIADNLVYSIYVWPQAGEDGHALLLFIDTSLKSVELFDPHGSELDKETIGTYRNLLPHILKAIQLPGDNWRILLPMDLCPSWNWQRNIPICWLYTILYLILRISCPHQTRAQILSEVSSLPKEQQKQLIWHVVQMLEEAKNFLQEVEAKKPTRKHKRKLFFPSSVSRAEKKIAQEFAKEAKQISGECLSMWTKPQAFEDPRMWIRKCMIHRPLAERIQDFVEIFTFYQYFPKRIFVGKGNQNQTVLVQDINLLVLEAAKTSYYERGEVRVGSIQSDSSLTDLNLLAQKVWDIVDKSDQPMAILGEANLVTDSPESEHLNLHWKWIDVRTQKDIVWPTWSVPNEFPELPFKQSRSVRPLRLFSLFVPSVRDFS